MCIMALLTGSPDVWNAGLSKEDAMVAYIEEVNKQQAVYA
jgi:hypothetical protein